MNVFRKKSDVPLLIISFVGLALFCYSVFILISAPSFSELNDRSVLPHDQNYWKTYYAPIFISFFVDTLINAIVAFFIAIGLYQIIKQQTIAKRIWRWLLWFFYGLLDVALLLYTLGSALDFFRLSTVPRICFEAIIVFNILLPVVVVLLALFATVIFVWSLRDAVNEKPHALLIAMTVLIAMGLFILFTPVAANIGDKFNLAVCGF